jgi:hypothetical protein
MSAISAKVIADSVSPAGVRLTTLQLAYPRFIHAEFMTHRVFSRNASSSRAIPVMKMLRQVWSDPAMPVHWGQNQAGMQARASLQGLKLELARSLWRNAGRVACVFAWAMTKVGLHKQVANRLLEPWQTIHVLVTATEWENFFELRAHPDAQPEIHELALRMQEALSASTPAHKNVGEWHLPYVTEDEMRPGGSIFEFWQSPGMKFTKEHVLHTARACSMARCARVSFLRHDGLKPKVVEDLDLRARLVDSRPIHASPSEHQAMVAPSPTHWSGNFRGWVQHRKLIEAQHEGT